MTGWVTDRFGAAVSGDARLRDLVQLALRRNAARAHLLVSPVLGKHIPADPRVVHAAGLELGERVGKALDGADALVLGFAETATALGHCVAEGLGAEYLHSTRRLVPGVAPVAGFDEPHSHAVGHLLLPESPELLGRGDVLVLVDDELSTGRTARNAIAALHRLRPRRRYLLAALVDVRDAAEQQALATFAAELGVQIDVVSLARGTVELPAGFVDRTAAARTAEVAAPTPRRPRPAPLHAVAGWPGGVRDGGRHGFHPSDTRAARSAAATLAAGLVPALGDRVLVLGTEELMYAPLLIALELAQRHGDVRVSSTTRSPVVSVDADGYPIRSALTFPAFDGQGTRYAYNVGDAYTDILVVVDDAADPERLRAGLLAELRGQAERVHLVTVPSHRPLPPPLRGPEFGSYPPADVGWLLTDISDVPLEAPAEEREEAIQSGGAHYAESLPIEYQPDAEYRGLFEQALERSATRLAHAVGVLTEIVLAERGPRPVLASLARAGTPVAILMRRWAHFAHGLDLPHYAVSIVRGRGLDGTALRYLAAHHDPSDVVFVDGWTGKGAIATELAAALAAAPAGFDADLAVLADPGSCARTFGTREDFLVPSACLNSTVSGLVSRTVLNHDVVGPGQYHGAKFYRELAAADVSARFLAAVTDRFAEVAGDVAAAWPLAQQADRTPTWAGRDAVAELAGRYGIDDLTLVKPGVGETTRVLLRRVPWRVLVRPDAGDEVAHVRLLAGQRGVPVEEVAGLTYRCVGIVHPRFTRGASGTTGRAVVG